MSREALIAQLAQDMPGLQGIMHAAFADMVIKYAPVLNAKDHWDLAHEAAPDCGHCPPRVGCDCLGQPAMKGVNYSMRIDRRFDRDPQASTLCNRLSATFPGMLGVMVNGGYADGLPRLHFSLKICRAPMPEEINAIAKQVYDFMKAI